VKSKEKCPTFELPVAWISSQIKRTGRTKQLRESQPAFSAQADPGVSKKKDGD
jgi:hypothetical protein